MSEELLGAIEAGGTKFVLAVGTADGDIRARTSIPTTDPETTRQAACDWLRGQGPVAALGIGSFGPVELDPQSPKWGFITDTPKPGWSDCDLGGWFRRALGIPVGFDTDVNGAALGEQVFGAGQGTDGVGYVTVGTGIGGGLIVGGALVHGAGHPEVGHCYPKREAHDRDFTGHCPFHGDCMEGLASGPAIIARWGKTLSDLPADHEAHELVAGYLAQLCHTLFACCAVERVVLGGGVTKAPGLIERVAEKTREIGAGYLPGSDRHSVVAPGLGENSGIVGALLLAKAALG